MPQNVPFFWIMMSSISLQEEYREASKQLRYTQAVENELRDEISAEEMTSRMIKYTGLARGANSLRNKRRKR
jgi:hypothetical protein